VEKGDFLFVYGTLRRGEYADLHKQSGHFNIKPCGVDHINGRIYHLGAYPGFKPFKGLTEFVSNKPTVVGERFLVLDPAIGAFLDAYEGYISENPKEGLYDRQKFATCNGYSAWVYIYNGPISSDQIIQSGDWCKNPDIPLRQKVFGQRAR
jgi:gamma-glutamylcyclotransferase (GGCT)/AIG2-like uncharacterized protein YtfP